MSAPSWLTLTQPVPRLNLKHRAVVREGVEGLDAERLVARVDVDVAHGAGVQAAAGLEPLEHPATGRLQGGAAPSYQTYDQVKCYAPRRVLVRVRADFARPVALKPTRDRSLLVAVARLRVAEIAVRTPGGKPLVYAQVLESGRARLFTARDCF